MTLAVVALGVDRFVLGGATGPASAAAALAAGESDAAAVPAERTVAKPAIGGVPVASQLKMLGEVAVDRPRDAFAPPVRWLQAIKDAEEAAAVKPVAEIAKEEPVDTAAAKFKRHQLISVTNEHDVPMRAVIKVAGDDPGKTSIQVVRIGESLGGYDLQAIEKNEGTNTTTAVFVDPAKGQRVELELVRWVEAGKSR